MLPLMNTLFLYLLATIAIDITVVSTLYMHNVSHFSS